MAIAGSAKPIWREIGTRHTAFPLLRYANPKTDQYDRAYPRETKTPAVIMSIVPLRCDLTHSAWYAGAVEVVKPLPVTELLAP